MNKLIEKKEFEGCDKCQHSGKGLTEYPCNTCVHNAIDHYKPMTNADYIRGLNDEELAEFLDAVWNTFYDTNAGSFEFTCEHCEDRNSCNICFRDWLKAERAGGIDG